MMHPQNKKSVVFVCFGNACRSQMSEGWGHYFGGDEWEVFSAGSTPAGFVAEEATRVMSEKGIDLSSYYSKGVQELPYQSFDLVVLMGCGDNCPTLAAKERVSWDIVDPIGQSLEVFRQVRDDLGERIKELLAETPPTS